MASMLRRYHIIDLDACGGRRRR